MFGKKQSQTDLLANKVEQLEKLCAEQEERFASQLQRLRIQVAGLSTGIPITPESILRGLPYAEIPKDQVESFMQRLPNVLLLDVRSDEAWDRAHIATAKHIVAEQVFGRLNEMPDKHRPILVMSNNGNQSIPVCELLAREGFHFVFNAGGGMLGYEGPVVGSEIPPIDITQVRGTDRSLIEKVAKLLDSDVRPGLVRDGGDLQLVAVEEGVVKIAMVGACHGCGAQSNTVQYGIKSYLTHMCPEVKGIEDLTGTS